LEGRRQNFQTHEGISKGRRALEYLEAGNEVMDKYRPSTLKIWPSVEMWLKSKGWGRGMILWHGFGA